METDRLQLMEWTHEFTAHFAEMVSDPVVMEFISGGRPLTLDEATEISDRGSALWDEYGIGPWAAFERTTGEWVGRIGLNLLADWPRPHQWEVGFELRSDFWGQGLAVEGARPAIKLGFETARLQQIISVTRADNQRSRRVMEKAGLTYRGAMQWRTAPVVWYAIDSSQWADARADPAFCASRDRSDSSRSAL